MQTDIDFHQLAEALGDGVIVCDAGGAIIFWNHSATRIFGFTEAEALGQSLDLIIPERLRQRHWDGYRRTMETGESRYGEGELLSVPAMRRDGATVSIEFTIVPLRDAEGRMTGIVSVMRDATARFEEMRSLRRKLAEAARPAG